MKTIDRQYESLSTKDMSESTQPYFDKFYREPSPEVKAMQKFWTGIGDRCWKLGLMGQETNPIFALGRERLQAGDTIDKAVRAACVLADTIAGERRRRAAT